MTSLKVLHCIPSMEGGGAERQLSYLAGALRDVGCQVDVALQHGGPNLAALRDAGATVHHLALRGNHDVRVVSRLLKVISTVQPDVVQCWLTQMQIAGGAAAMIARRPWVLSERSSAAGYPRTMKNALRIRMGSFADAIVSNSVAGDHYWSSRAGRGVRRYVIPNGLPLTEIERSPAASSDDEGIAPGDILVLFAGRLDELKNAAVFVRAIAQVRPSLPVRAMICGEGPLYPEIERLIAEFNLERRVRLTGYTSHLWSLMKRANVLVSTSLCEGNPNVVLEAMACRCPLVVSDIPAHLEILDEHSALMVAPADVNGFARSIEQVIDRPDEAAKRARMAAARSERHALAIIARQYVSVYADVVAQHRAKDVVI